MKTSYSAWEEVVMTVDGGEKDVVMIGRSSPGNMVFSSFSSAPMIGQVMKVGSRIFSISRETSIGGMADENFFFILQASKLRPVETTPRR